MPQPETYASFVFERSTRIETLTIELQEFRHTATGAVHIHLQADDQQNAFLVAFRTVPEDSTGVAHVLEHTALCGSRRYPVRDPFFMMTRRSLNTFMNAFTSSDWTAYPFASCNHKDFYNLLDVYLDAAFFPNLDKMDFLQEGHRFEFATMDDPTTDLTYKGIVFNEMKGAMSSPTSALWQTMTSHLFPTETYHHNSGGEPVNIPDLTHEQLQSFHATHYHPSNAIFITYGNMPAVDHQAVFEARALQDFGAQDHHIRVGLEQRFAAPKRVSATYAVEPGQPTERKTHIVLGWVLDENTDAETLLTTHLLTGVLLDNSASPLRHALETSDFGEAPSPLSGLSDSTREMIFCCGFEGADAADADAAEQYILDTLRRIADEGIAQDQIEAELHQLELSQREVSGDRFPYGLNMMLSALTPALYDAPIAAVLDIDPILCRLRERIQDPAFIKGLVRRLVDNPHRVCLVMEPDAALADREQTAEKDKLATIKAGLSQAEIEHIIAQAQQLKARQESQDNPDLLPEVTREDIPTDFDLAVPTNSTIAAMPAASAACATNGLVYAELIVDLPAFNTEQQAMLPFFSQVVDELGSGGRDYLATQALQASVTGGIYAHSSIHASVDNPAHFHAHYMLSGKALQRNSEPLLNLMMETLEQPRFDEHDRLRELVSQARLRSERSVVNQGHTLAMRAASASLSPIAAMQHRRSGLAAIQWIKKLDQSIADDAGMMAMEQTLSSIQDSIASSARQMLLIAEERSLASLEQQAATLWHSPNTGETSAFTLAQPEATRIHQAWVTTTQVHFCARAYPAVTIDHPDAAILSVLGPFLRNNFLHRNIREQGGAYGGGAGFDASAGAFRFFSYRDPRLQETLQDFDRSIDWLLSTKHEQRLLDEAVLGVIAGMDAPGSPAGEIKATFHRMLRQRTPEQRRAYRQRILAVTLDDLIDVAGRYLKAEQANTAVITHQAGAESLRDTLEIITL